MLLVCGDSPRSRSLPTPSGAGVVRVGAEIERPVIRTTPEGQTWVVWQESGTRESRVFAGRLAPTGITARRSLAEGLGGSHFSPDLAASPDGRLWAVWVHRTGVRSRIAVRGLPDGKVGYLPGVTDTPHTPRVIVDQAAVPWVIWTGSNGGPDRIRVSSRTGGRWSRPITLSRGPDVPHFHPALGLNRLGFPTAAWSAFNGEGYEIRLRSWEGTRWKKTEIIAGGSGSSDAQPVLSLLQGETPVLAWTRSEAGRREILVSWKEASRWRRPVRIAAGVKGEGFPALAEAGGDLALAWSDREDVHLRTLNLADLQARAPAERTGVEAATGYHLDPQTFIAFGDSITFGAMNGPYQVEGYPPRLQTLLEDLFTDPRICNRGVPGEPTWEALSRVNSAISADLALYFLLMEGTNDVSAASYSMETTAFNLRQILLKCRDYGVFPMVATIIPRARNRWTAAAKERTQDLNQKILDLSRDIRVPLVDLYSAFMQIPAGHETLISDDNLHPNLTGYQVMAETWRDGIGRLPFPPLPLSALKYPRRGEVRVTWEADPRLSPAAGVIVWRIYRRRTGSASFQLRGSVPDETFSFTDTSADPEAEYVYALSALNSDQVEGPLSRTVLTEAGNPEPPINVAVSTVLNKAFLHQEHINRITWNPNPLNQDGFDITRYRVYRKSAGQADSAYTALGDIDAASTEFLDRGHASEADALGFVYGVSALDAEGSESSIEEGQR